jgi:hypothetical protein
LGLAPAITVHYADIHAMVHGQISIMAMGDRLWHAYLLTWLGSLILGGALALILYFGVLGGWRLWILWRLRRRRLHRSRL